MHRGFLGHFEADLRLERLWRCLCRFAGVRSVLSLSGMGKCSDSHPPLSWHIGGCGYQLLQRPTIDGLNFVVVEYAVMSLRYDWPPKRGTSVGLAHRPTLLECGRK